MSLDDVAKVTKIQPRILERLEAGLFDGLPAEVFVRGFVKSVARCVGLDEDEALRRYGACGSPAARALVETMSDLAPQTSSRASSPRILIPPARPPSEPPRVETMMLPMSGTLVASSTMDIAPVAAVVAPAMQIAPATSRPVESRLESSAVSTIEVAARVSAAVELPATEIAAVEIAPPSERAVVVAIAADVVAVTTDAVAVTTDAVAVTSGDLAVAPDGKKKRKRTRKPSAKSKRIATGTPAEPAPVVDAATGDDGSAVSTAVAATDAVAAVATTDAVAATDAAATATDAAADAVAATDAAATATDAATAAAAATATATATAAAAAAATAAEIDTVAATEDTAAIDTPATATEIDPVLAATDDAAAIDTAAAAAAADTAATDAAALDWTPRWAPKMPPLASSPSAPWRRPSLSNTPAPSLIIDDADPDSAERVLEERTAARANTRRSFLPPILLDREDRSTRQGGLTLAVIILLIAATLTLSYLMRRPSSNGAGMTLAETPTEILS